MHPLVSDNVQPPNNVQLVAINSSTLILSWDPPTQQSYPIISYNYTCIGINVSYTITGSVSDTTFSVTLLGLIPFSEYTCNVSTITSNGIGTLSNVNAITKEAGIDYDYITIHNTINLVPSKVTSLTVSSVHSNTSFLISWSLPNNPNGIITNYSATVMLYENNSVVFNNVIVSNLSVTVSTGLSKQTTIMAINFVFI